MTPPCPADHLAVAFFVTLPAAISFHHIPGEHPQKTAARLAHALGPEGHPLNTWCPRRRSRRPAAMINPSLWRRDQRISFRAPGCFGRGEAASLRRSCRSVGWGHRRNGFDLVTPPPHSDIPGVGVFANSVRGSGAAAQSRSSSCSRGRRPSRCGVRNTSSRAERRQPGHWQSRTTRNAAPFRLNVDLTAHPTWA